MRVAWGLACGVTPTEGGLLQEGAEGVWGRGWHLAAQPLRAELAAGDAPSGRKENDSLAPKRTPGFQMATQLPLGVFNPDAAKRPNLF